MRASRRGSAWLVVATLGVAAQASAAGQVHVVAPVLGPGVDFTSVQAAVTAAAEGDTVLIRAGTYGGFTVTAKSLAITADAGASVYFDAGCKVAGLAPDQFVSLRGLDVLPVDEKPALTLDTCPGKVWIENCTLTGQEGWVFGFPFTSSTSALTATQCDSVVLVHCVLLGGDSVESALIAIGSHVHAYASTLRGGKGVCDTPPDICYPGGAAAELNSSSLTAQGCTLTGGTSAPGIPLLPPVFPCLFASAGNGLLWNSGASSAFLYACQVNGGTGSSPCGLASPPIGAAGTGSGTLMEIAGATLDLAVASPLREQQVSSFGFTGTPGDLVSLHVALAPGDLFKPAFGGPWLLSGNTVMALFAAVPAGGVLSVPFVVPALPVGTESLAVTLQAARVSATGDKLVAEPARLVLLDASF